MGAINVADILTMQDLANGHLDVKALGEAVTGDENTIVTTRTGETYPSLSNALNQIDGQISDANDMLVESVTTLFQNGGLPATPFKTKALMTASSLANDKYAMVTDDATNNGLYVKTAGAWVKSDYDPLVQVSTHTENIVKESVSSLDVSALLNRYDLTFAEAIVAVPSFLRKPGFKISYNNNEVRDFISESLTHWDIERFWLRPKVDFEGRINHFDPSMIYNFNIGTGSSITYGEGRYCVIVPVYDAETATLAVRTPYFKKSTMYTLNESGVTTSGLSGQSTITKRVTDTAVAYLAVNIQTEPHELGTVSNLEYTKESMYVTYDDVITGNIFGTGIGDETPQLEFNPYLGGIHKVYTSRGVSYSSRFFKPHTIRLSQIHPEAIFHKLEIQKGQTGLYSEATGNLLRIRLTILRRTDTHVTLWASISYTGLEEDFTGNLPNVGEIDEDGFAEIIWNSSPDRLQIKLVVDSKLIPIQQPSYVLDVEIHPRLIRNALYATGLNEGVLLKQYEDVGVSILSSNMAHETAQSFTEVKKVFRNGSLSYNVQGEASKKHQQSTLISSKTANFKGVSDIYVDAVASYPDNPKVSVLREPSKAPYNKGGLIGRSMSSQWIHPDICYVPESVGGYKYWMTNSNFPNGSDRQEDADLFVSNNGIDWTRVKSLLEEDDGVGFRLPTTHWSNNYPQGFMAIPNTNNTFEFAFDGTPVAKKITGYLNHDPAISTHNGYVNVYISYNIGVDDSSYPYRFTVCYRTNNGEDWEIVRADGTSFPYNEVNAQLIFTKTNGVRNHISFSGGAGDEGTAGVSPQIVKVSDTEWYFYAREDRAPVTGSKLYLVRYRGTSPYNFDWSEPEGMSTDTTSLPRLWHFGMQYINGLYYCMTHGYLLTSTDGVNFSAKPNQMFWRGMSSDLYKPSFCVGHDGKVKVVYGIQSMFSVPHPLNASQHNHTGDYSKVDDFIKITSTLLCEFSSLQDMVNRAENPVEDAYVDVVVMVIDQASRTTHIRIIPCVRDITSLLQTFPVSYDDEVYVSAYMNSRYGGKVAFSGVALNIR